MAPQDAAVIRLWLETNLAEATKSGEDALEKFRADVKAMGPDVEQVFRDMGGTVETVTKDMAEATVTASKTTGEALEDMGVKLKEAAGTGEGEGGKGGFAGLAANVLKGEKVMSGLAGGAGFGRMGPMLESITSAMGLAGGVGMAGGGLIFAFEVLVPKIEAAIEKMTGWNDATQKALEATEKLIAATQKLEALKIDEAGKAMQEYLPGSELTGHAAGALGASGLGEQATEEEKAAMEGRIAPIQGMDAAGYKALQVQAREKVAARIQQANIDRAAQWVEDSIKPGAVGKRARAMLKGLAQQAPGAFPPEFAEFLQGLEETPGQAAAAEEAIEANDPDQQYMERQKERRAAYKAQKADRHADAIHDKTVDWLNDEAIKAGGKAAQDELNRSLKDDQIAQRAKEKAAREQARHARENTPSAINARERKEEHDNALGTVQSMTYGFDADEQHKIAQHLQQNYPLGQQLGASLFDQVQYAVNQTRADIQRGIAAGFKRQNVASESFFPG